MRTKRGRTRFTIKDEPVIFIGAHHLLPRVCRRNSCHRDAIKLSEKALVGGNLVTHREDDVNTLLLTWKKKERREVRDEFLEIEIEHFSISVLG